MDEQTLQALSKALTHLIFQNGVVENLHADGEVVIMKQVMYREKVHYLFFCETVTLLAGGIAYIAVMVYNGV